MTKDIFTASNYGELQTVLVEAIRNALIAKTTHADDRYYSYQITLAGNTKSTLEVAWEWKQGALIASELPSSDNAVDCKSFLTTFFSWYLPECTEIGVSLYATLTEILGEPKCHWSPDTGGVLIAFDSLLFLIHNPNPDS